MKNNLSNSKYKNKAKKNENKDIQQFNLTQYQNQFEPYYDN